MNVALKPILASLEKSKALILGLDNVLYPAKDYDLQVFYMFGQFVEFLEGKPIGMAITEDLKSLYLSSGEIPTFKSIADKYNLKNDYHDKLDKLYHQVQLPLRLELFPVVFELLKELKEKNIQLYVLTAGDPFMQLNKLKQMDWQGLDKDIKLYFVNELIFKKIDPINFILEENKLQENEVHWLEYQEIANQTSKTHKVSLIDPEVLLSN